MKLLWKITIVLFAGVHVATAQINKDDISVVQFSAKFVKANEISLEEFKNYNIQTFYMEDHAKLFAKENIKSLPTIIVYNDGEIMYKIDGGITMKIPETCKEEIQETIEEILRSRF